MNEEKRKELMKRSDELLRLSKPLIKFINDNFNPHTKIIIDVLSAEVVMGECMVRTEEFIRD